MPNNCPGMSFMSAACSDFKQFGVSAGRTDATALEPFRHFLHSPDAAEWSGPAGLNLAPGENTFTHSPLTVYP
jgi:hypothetical protein